MAVLLSVLAMLSARTRRPLARCRVLARDSRPGARTERSGDRRDSR